MWQLCFVGRTLYYNYQSRCSTLAIDAQSSMFCTWWSSIDITSAFLNADDIHDDDTVLVTPPPILVKMDIVKPNTVWQVKKAIYGLREAPRLWQKERDQKLRDLEFVYKDKLAHLVQSHIHPSLWFIAEGRIHHRSITLFEVTIH